METFLIIMGLAVFAVICVAIYKVMRKDLNELKAVPVGEEEVFMDPLWKRTRLDRGRRYYNIDDGSEVTDAVLAGVYLYLFTDENGYWYDPNDLIIEQPIEDVAAEEVYVPDYMPPTETENLQDDLDKQADMMPRLDPTMTPVPRVEDPSVTNDDMDRLANSMPSVDTSTSYDSSSSYDSGGSSDSGSSYD